MAAPFADSVGIGWYPIDIHRSGDDDVGLSCRTRPFQIPLGALIPVRIVNLIAACKNIGTTHLTNGCYRLHPVEWNIGEAAGALAAFALQQGLSPAAVRAERARRVSAEPARRRRAARLAGLAAMSTPAAPLASSTITPGSAEVSLHYVTAGDGEPVVLLHGWPSTWYEWRRGDAAARRPLSRDRARPARPRRQLATGRPATTRRRVAADLWQLLSGTLGLARWHLVGHDWGGPVAFALAAAHPQAIRTLTIVDVTLPGIGPDISQGGKRWHHAFHMTPDLPEALVQGRERAYLTWFYESFSWQRGAFDAADIDEYLRTYTPAGRAARRLRLLSQHPATTSPTTAPCSPRACG